MTWSAVSLATCSRPCGRSRSSCYSLRLPQPGRAARPRVSAEPPEPQGDCRPHWANHDAPVVGSSPPFSLCSSSPLVPDRWRRRLQPPGHGPRQHLSGPRVTDDRRDGPEVGAGRHQTHWAQGPVPNREAAVLESALGPTVNGKANVSCRRISTLGLVPSKSKPGLYRGERSQSPSVR